MPDNDVSVSGSSPDTDLPPSDHAPDTDPSAVTDGTGAADDRPLKNYIAEQTRRMQQMERQMASIAELIATRPPVAQTWMPPQQASSPAQLSDADLAEAARQGNWEAQSILSQRIAQRAASNVVQANQVMQTVQARIAQMGSTYKDFNDTESELYQAGIAELNQLAQMGADVRHPSTKLRAMEQAVLNRPDLVAKQMGQSVMAGEQARQSTHAGGSPIASGTRPRVSATQPPGKRKLSEKERAIAQRMGIRDPENSIARMEKRHAEGRAGVDAKLIPVIEASQLVNVREG